jgi:hypothetical protein
MKRFARILLRLVAVTAQILLLATIVLWIHGRWNTSAVDVTGSQAVYRWQSNAQDGLTLKVNYLTPGLSAYVKGMSMTSHGWSVTPDKMVSMSVMPLPTDPAGKARVFANQQGSPFAFQRMKFHLPGFIWIAGFTADHANLPGPFPAREVDTFTLSFIVPVVILALITVITGYFGFRVVQATESARIADTA